MTDGIKSVIRGAAYFMLVSFACAVCYNVVTTLAQQAEERQTARIAEQKRQEEEQSAEQKRMQAMQAACAKYGLTLIDVIPPHTPKCLNLQTGIMTVPATLFDLRGGAM